MKSAGDHKARRHTSSETSIKDRQVQQNDKSGDVGDKQIRATVIIKPHRYDTKYKREEEMGRKRDKQKEGKK